MASIGVAPHPVKEQPSFQPFQCQTCQSRFTRHENLKRHAALHARTREGASLTCHFCAATFSRSDLRQRHTRRKHPDQQASQLTKQSRVQPDGVFPVSVHEQQSNLASVTPDEMGDLDLDTAWRTILDGHSQQHNSTKDHELGGHRNIKQECGFRLPTRTVGEQHRRHLAEDSSDRDGPTAGSHTYAKSSIQHTG